MNKRAGVGALLFLICFSIGFVPVEIVDGQNQSSSVSITKVTPSLSGAVSSYVTVQGTIATLNGNYQVLFDQSAVASGTSNGYSVTASFAIPEINVGTYSLTLKDLSTHANATNQFQVTTSYTIAPLSNQIQERDSITLNVTVTGGQPNTHYTANITVMIPSPLNTTFSKIVSLGTSSEKGTASSLVTYPENSFLPAGALTDYSGTYYAYFNQSDNVARTNFSVGFLDSTSYHRGQTAIIKAVGYQPSQAANLIVTNTATGALLDQESITASNDGTIATSWLVSANAAIGIYTVQITTTGTPKAIVDSESISVIGYSVQIKTVNLGNEIVPLIRLQVQDATTNVVVNGSSGNDGIATFSLETGVQSLNAFWNGVNVGQTNITVIGNGVFTMVCTLTDINFVVHNENGVPMPFVHLDFGFQYHTASGVTQVGSASGETNVLGFYKFNSTLTGVDYNVTASLYNQVFSVSAVNNVPVQSFSQVLITCPNEALTINVIGNNQAPIADARIELVEVSNNLFYTATTDSNGSVASAVTFGTYRARIYKNNLLINDTNIDVFSNTQKQILCTLYGIKVSVSVVDLLGQPIQNVNVTLNGPATERFSALTHDNGKVVFNDVIGGAVQIVAFAQGAPNDFQAVVQTVNQPTSIQIKLDKYVALGPFLVQTNTLLTIVVILTLLILFVAVEIYRRKKR
jgi:hypothetical protein